MFNIHTSKWKAALSEENVLRTSMEEKKQASLKKKKDIFSRNYRNRVDGWMYKEEDREEDDLAKEDRYGPHWKRNTPWLSSSKMDYKYNRKDHPSYVSFRDRDKTRERQPWNSPSSYVCETERVQSVLDAHCSLKQPPFTQRDAYPLHGLTVSDFVYTGQREKSKEMGAQFRFSARTESERINDVISKRDKNLTEQWVPPPPYPNFRDFSPSKHHGGRFETMSHPKCNARKYESMKLSPGKTWKGDVEGVNPGGVYRASVSFQSKTSVPSAVVRVREKWKEGKEIYETVVHCNHVVPSRKSPNFNVLPERTEVPPKTYYKGIEDIRNGTFEGNMAHTIAEHSGPENDHKRNIAARLIHTAKT